MTPLIVTRTSSNLANKKKVQESNLTAKLIHVCYYRGCSLPVQQIPRKIRTFCETTDANDGPDVKVGHNSWQRQQLDG